MKKALVLFFAIVIGIAFTVSGFAQEKAQPAAKVEQQQVETDKPADKPAKTKKAKKVKKTKKTKKAKKVKAAPPAEEKPAETK